LFPTPIFDILTKYDLIRTTEGIFNQIETTPLGKIGLQSYILPKTVDYLNHQLRVRLDQGYQLTLQQIFPIFQYVFNSRGIKSNPFIYESYLLWMEENEIQKIVRTLNQNPSLRILYKNDFTILIDTTSRILKFIHKFIENFYPDYGKQQIYSLYYRIRFGILPDLIPWAKRYKNENPRIFRSLIHEGFSDPEDLRKIPDISLSKFLNVSVSKARRLKQEITVSLE